MCMPLRAGLPGDFASAATAAAAAAEPRGRGLTRKGMSMEGLADRGIGMIHTCDTLLKLIQGMVLRK